MSIEYITQIYNLFDYKRRPKIEERTIKVREYLARTGNTSPSVYIDEAIKIWKVYLQDLFEGVAKEIKTKGYPLLINQGKPKFLFLLDQSLEVAKDRIRKQVEVLCKPNETNSAMKRVSNNFEQLKEYIVAKWDYEGDIFETRIPKQRTQIDFDLSKLNEDFRELLKKVCEAYINIKNIDPNEKPDNITLVLGEKFNTNQVRELGRFLKNSNSKFQIGNTYPKKDLANSVTLPTTDPGIPVVQSIIEEINAKIQKMAPVSSELGLIEINKAKFSEDFRSVTWGESLTKAQSRVVKYMYEEQTQNNTSSFSTRLLREKAGTTASTLKKIFTNKIGKDEKETHPLFDRLFEQVKRGHHRLRI